MRALDRATDGLNSRRFRQAGRLHPRRQPRLSRLNVCYGEGRGRGDQEGRFALTASLPHPPLNAKPWQNDPCVCVYVCVLRTQGGELIPLSNQLSGAVGGRASSALISIVKASLRAVFRGGSFIDGCGSAAQTVLRRCLRLLRRVACCSLQWRRTRLVTRQGLMLCRDVRRMRAGGEGACVTRLLEMPYGAQR